MGGRDVEFQVGAVVEFFEDEVEILHESASQMLEAMTNREFGWARAYLTAHREAHKVFQRAFKRSHAIQGPGHGSGH